MQFLLLNNIGGQKMNKADLITKISEQGYKKSDAEKIINTVINSITDALKNDEKVTLMGFGTFEVKNRAERTGRNPQTNEEIKIPASKAPVFKAGKALKEQING